MFRKKKETGREKHLFFSLLTKKRRENVGKCVCRSFETSETINSSVHWLVKERYDGFVMMTS